MNNLIEIRIHGRGGQGVVTAAELLAKAAFYDGKFAQAFPNFGVERRGAPIESYVRISDKPILVREQIQNPDYLIIQDVSLLKSPDKVLKGVDSQVKILINGSKDDCLKLNLKVKDLKCFPVTDLALKVLGKPIINTGLLAFFINQTKLVKLSSFEKVIKEHFSVEVAEKNLELINSIKDETKELMN